MVRTGRTDGASNAEGLDEVGDEFGRMYDCINNETLSYIQHYISRSTIENLRNVVVRFYSSDEITTAKSLLWMCVSEDVIGKLEKRKSTTARTALEADVQDILMAFQKLDAQAKILPPFSAVDLERVPRYSPGDIGDSVLRDKLVMIEQRLSVMENKCEKNTDSIKTLEVTV